MESEAIFFPFCVVWLGLILSLQVLDDLGVVEKATKQRTRKQFHGLFDTLFTIPPSAHRPACDYTTWPVGDASDRKTIV